MSDLRKAAEMALEALRNAEIVKMEQLNAMYALQEALAQPEQEPVAWGFRRIKDGVILDIKNADFEHEGYEEIYTVPLYTAPPKREWVGLTDEEIEQCFVFDWSGEFYANWRKQTYEAIKAKLKEKNT